MYYITPIELKDIPGVRYRRNNRVVEILSEFAHGGSEAVELNWRAMNYRTMGSARNSFTSASKREGFNVNVVQRIDRLFLVKKGE